MKSFNTTVQDARKQPIYGTLSATQINQAIVNTVAPVLDNSSKVYRALENSKAGK